MRNPLRLKNLRMRFLPLYLVGAALLFVVRPGLADYALGGALVLAGAALRTWGAGHLEKTTSLTVTGPYAHLRHPLYLGTLLVGSGISVMVGGGWALAVLAAFLPWFFLRYFPRKERTESARLEEHYGGAFATYRAEVPALLPRWHGWSPAPGVLSSEGARGWSLDRYSDNNELGTLLGVMTCVVAFGFRTAYVLGGIGGP
jgi:protein-S-isoprenylcysteine O-methyltransferase Ste14